MILSVALRSLCPLVISPGFLIHSFMSSAHSVRGGVWLDCQISVFLDNCSSPQFTHAFSPGPQPETLWTVKSCPPSIAFSLPADLPSEGQGGYRGCGRVCMRGPLFAYVCIRTVWTYVCCEDPMAYFTRANLSNERWEKGIGSALVGGSGRERSSAGSKL